MFKNKLYILFLALAFITLFFACKKEKTSYEVKGKLNNVSDSVFFAARETHDSIFVDTIKINKKGEFSFTGNIDTLTIISLYFKSNTVSPYILVDKGWKVEVDGDIDMPDMIEVKGGQVNNELTAFKKANKELLTARKELLKYKNTKRGSIIDSTENKADHVEMKNIEFDLNNIASEYVKNNPRKISSVILLDNFFKNEESLERLTQGLDQLEGVAYDFPLAVKLREYRDKVKKSAVNASAPIFNLNDKDNNKISLTTMRGKYVLVSFMSTTCPACQELLPDLIKEYDAIKKDKKNIEMVSLVIDVEEKEISDMPDLKSIKWPLIPINGGWSANIFDDYNVKEVPYMVLISPEGKVLERDVQVFNLNAKLNSYPNIKKEEEKKNRVNRFKKN